MGKRVYSYACFSKSAIESGQRNCHDKARCKKPLEKCVHQYALRINSVFTGLFDESKLAASSTPSPDIFCLGTSEVAVFENRLPPLIRNEQVREDSVRTFAAARDRAHKHASNNLHGVSTIHVSSVVSTPTPVLKNELESL